MMETVVIVAIAILVVIFSAAFLAVVFLCRHKYCRTMDMISAQHSDMRPEVQLISASPVDGGDGGVDVELGEVTMSVPSLERLLEDEQWIDDASGLVPPCIHILKTCHHLTERMVAMTMSNTRHVRTQEVLTEIVSVVKKIGPRVDDIVESMYPPLDSRLLEARCTALVLSVRHLVMITKHVCHISGQLDWIDQALADVDDSLTFLREAARGTTPEHNPNYHDNASGVHNNAFVNHDESSQV